MAILITSFYPLYNVFAQSNENENIGTDQETQEVQCDDDEEVKDGDCVPIECDPGE